MGGNQTQPQNVTSSPKAKAIPTSKKILPQRCAMDGTTDR